ncbi:hypothetical protein DOO74_21490 [Rhodobacteraceae bacterium AsT-22]|nr:hypothetical protein DOO74_21490 [Rhodobacteraceae bacterium AsT-22]
MITYRFICNLNLLISFRRGFEAGRDNFTCPPKDQSKKSKKAPTTFVFLTPNHVRLFSSLQRLQSQRLAILINPT